jgi:hypothetical protein
LPLLVLLTSRGGLADTTLKRQCIEAHTQAQEARQNSKLRQAREHLNRCAQTGCPALVKNDCGPWLNELAEQIPKLRVDLVGVEASKALLKLDGEKIAAGTDVEIDPGEHKLQIEASGYEPFRQTFQAEAGKPVNLRAELKPRSEPAPLKEPPPPSRSRVAPLVLGGVGLVGLGLFTYLGLSGKAQENDLKACKPFCEQSRVDAVEQRYLGANIGLGVGVVALGVATYLWFRTPPPPQSTVVVPWLAPGVSGLGLERSF